MYSDSEVHRLQIRLESGLGRNGPPRPSPLYYRTLPDGCKRIKRLYTDEVLQRYERRDYWDVLCITHLSNKDRDRTQQWPRG